MNRDPARRAAPGSALATVLAAIGALPSAVAARPAGVPSIRDRASGAGTPSDAYLLDRHGVVLDRMRLDFGVRRLEWVHARRSLARAVEAIVAGEDRAFASTPASTGSAQSRLRYATGSATDGAGASTITMQVAGAHRCTRAAARGQRGSWRRKLQQMRVARALESRWSKHADPRGLPEPARFPRRTAGHRRRRARCSPARRRRASTLAESLVLAALLPGARRATSSASRARAVRARERSARLDCRLRCGPRQSGLLSRAYARPRDRTATSPRTSRASCCSEPGERVRTTLDASVQRAARDVLARHLAALDGAQRPRRRGCSSSTTRRGDVLAYVGSAGRASRARQVDGVRARRQAGSTLKPFLYELALERRYLTAASLLDDSPVNLDTASGVYLPQNYDRDFKGLVSVRTALGSSLNVPAVRTLMLVGVERFPRPAARSSAIAGITRDGEFYGYSLALGSAEVSLWEQAHGLSHARARRRAVAAARCGRRAIRPTRSACCRRDASFIVADILRRPRGARAHVRAGQLT